MIKTLANPCERCTVNKKTLANDVKCMRDKGNFNHEQHKCVALWRRNNNFSFI